MSCWQELWCWRQWWRQSRWKSCWHDDNNKIRCERKKVFTTIAVWKTHVGAQKVPHEKYLEYFKPYQQMIYLGTESISSRTESILSLLSSTLTCKVESINLGLVISQMELWHCHHYHHCWRWRPQKASSSLTSVMAGCSSIWKISKSQPLHNILLNSTCTTVNWSLFFSSQLSPTRSQRAPPILRLLTH